MAEDFDVKEHGKSITKLLKMADLCITQPGGGVHAERIVDDVTNELRHLPAEKCLAVLAEVDED